MNDWKESNIKALGTVFTNNTFSRDCLNYDSGEYQNIHYGDVLITFSDVIDANSPLVPYINSNETVKSDTFIKDGDIIVADTAEDETVGKVCEIQNVGERKIVSGLHTLWYRPNKNEFAPKYLGYLLNTFECHKQLVRKSHGIKVLSINKGDFWKTIIKYPASLNEQNAIAGIISKVDQCIENVQKTIDATQKLKKSSMQNLLTGRMKPDGTMRKDNEFYEHPKLGKVPIGWDVKQIKDIALQVTDGEHQTPRRTETGYYLLSARNIKNGYLELSDVDYVDEEEFNRIKKRCHPEENDILISCSGTIGNVSKVPAGIDCVMVRSAALVKVNHKKINSSFLEYLLQSYPLQTAMKVAVSASVQGNLFQGAIKKLRFIAPADIKEQENISLVFDSITEIIKTKQNKKNVLLRLKKSLMQNLLTGKKRVDVNKINALLESIK